MKKISFIFLLLCLFSLPAPAQNKSDSAIETVPANFGSGGCSLFPDGNYIDCCTAHDKAYYFGGSWKERLKADNVLFKCVAAKKGWWHKPLAVMMWSGVRIGGVSWLPTSFRWGFGRNKLRKPGVNKCQKERTRNLNRR